MNGELWQWIGVGFTREGKFVKAWWHMKKRLNMPGIAVFPEPEKIFNTKYSPNLKKGFLFFQF